nr:MAG TPA: hypothetical protein [Caudoviricetes sp.]
MKLIDILRQELPKRGGWPEGANRISSHADGKVFFDGKFAPLGFSLPRADDGWHASKHPYNYTNAVTREEYEASGWDGKGLPPVGTKCECQFRDDWTACKILFAGAQIFVAEIDGDEYPFMPDHTAFRPIRTEAERAIDEMVRLSGVSTGAAKILYDAGYRK